MDYTSRYGLEYNPFVKNVRESLVETSQYREVTARLNYLLQIKGFGILTGNPGVGKTTSIRNWMKSLNQSANKVIYIPLSTLTVVEFYRHMAFQLGCEPAFRKAENFRMIQGAIRRMVIEKKMTPIIVLDEANYMKNAILNDLKILFNFDMDSSNKAVILLTGLPQLSAVLSLNIHEPLRQRITMNYNLLPLTLDESKKYLVDKLKCAGCHQEVFERNAMEAIASSASGLPRVIDKIANTSLLIGNQMNENIITSDTVMKAVEDNVL
ncbi:MAG: AAA family ATPase [Eubacteriales bacterium]|jgi:type II secretory pathway predicted ATPase ExeA